MAQDFRMWFFGKLLCYKAHGFAIDLLVTSSEHLQLYRQMIPRFFFGFNLPKKVGENKNTVDGWNPKQPPGMYKTL